ncbi:MAG: Gfo/Idh/MocA family oxidoreductase, partial [Planctomycetes bacterium]|nr:Gfo/Idh/MocA family oxidoreductase [Planctomycetota bacterium]
MADTLNRRNFLGRTALSGAAGLAVTSHVARGANAAGETIVIGVMGLSRGKSLALNFARQTGVVVKYVCDVDRNRAAAGAAAVEKVAKRSPKVIADFRKMLEDNDVDVLVCAAPNHWHAPATILACAHGKHVYVEKPCCHNPHEGELMVQAARKHKRAVQMGSQRRSGAGTIQAMQELQQGVIGRVYLSKSWYGNRRPAVVRGKETKPPAYLDYELWQGPAPRRAYIPYQSLNNKIHYNWHWFWHWGNGELGNNGVHTLDLCRWGLGVDYPIRVTSSGGRYRYKDDQQTPDTHTVCFEFPDRKQITWEGLSCNSHKHPFVKFFGETGTMSLQQNGSYTVYDLRDKPIKTHKANSRGDVEHIANFLAAIRNDTPLKLNAEIE